jgi:LysW-gamma-L-lysine carboxypeptidase
LDVAIGRNTLSTIRCNLKLGCWNIYSPSGNEKNFTRLYERMTKLVLRVHRDAVGNVIGEIGEGSPIVLLCGHMDTVSGEIPVRVEDGQLYGRGSVDAKGPLAAMIGAASKFVDNSFPGKIMVVGVVDEEGKGTGIEHFVKRDILSQTKHLVVKTYGWVKVVFG